MAHLQKVAYESGRRQCRRGTEETRENVLVRDNEKENSACYFLQKSPVISGYG